MRDTLPEAEAVRTAVLRRTSGHASLEAALELSETVRLLTGSFASAVHGTARATMDIDLVIDPSSEQLRAFVASLPTEHFYVSLDAALKPRGTGLRSPGSLRPTLPGVAGIEAVGIRRYVGKSANPSSP